MNDVFVNRKNRMKIVDMSNIRHPLLKDKPKFGLEKVNKNVEISFKLKMTGKELGGPSGPLSFKMGHADSQISKQKLVKKEEAIQTELSSTLVHGNSVDWIDKNSTRVKDRVLKKEIQKEFSIDDKIELPRIKLKVGESFFLKTFLMKNPIHRETRDGSKKNHGTNDKIENSLLKGCLFVNSNPKVKCNPDDNNKMSFPTQIPLYRKIKRILDTENLTNNLFLSESHHLNIENRSRKSKNTRNKIFRDSAGISGWNFEREMIAENLKCIKVGIDRDPVNGSKCKNRSVFKGSSLDQKNHRKLNKSNDEDPKSRDLNDVLANKPISIHYDKSKPHKRMGDFELITDDDSKEGRILRSMAEQESRLNKKVAFSHLNRHVSILEGSHNYSINLERSLHQYREKYSQTQIKQTNKQDLPEILYHRKNLIRRSLYEARRELFNTSIGKKHASREGID